MMEKVQSEAGMQLIEGGGNPFTLKARLQELMIPLMKQTIEDVLPMLDGTDLIVCHAGTLAHVQAMAELQGLPFIAYVLAMSGATREQPGGTIPPAPGWFPFKGFYNRMSYKMAGNMMWPAFGKPVYGFRKELSLPPHTKESLTAVVQKAPMLHAISPHVIPIPKDWESHNHMTGFWFDTDFATWQPAPDLVAFLKGGSKPVYIGFGSMSIRDAEATTRLVLEAIAKSGERAVIASGWGGLKSEDLPETVFLLDEAPHGWLFPQMAAVVHHGGAGTMAAGMRAGVPSILVPHFADQFFWGQTVQSLGVGPNPIPRKRLTADNLPPAIRQAVRDEYIQKNATALGVKLRQEDGVGQAVEIIEVAREKM